MSPALGTLVTVTLGGGYPVTGTLEAVTPHPGGDFAVVVVARDAGLYRRGDVITPRLAWLGGHVPAGRAP